MRAMLAVSFCFAMIHCGQSEAQDSESVLTTCETLMRHLQTFIDIRTDMQITYSHDTCMSSSLMKMFVRESSAIVAMHAAPPVGINFTIAEDDDGLAQLLVLALIGRHYTAEYKANQVFFEFDSATQILTPHMPRCEYQRSFFVLLLFVSIVLLIFSLVIQNLNTMEANAIPTAAGEHTIVADTRPLPSATPSAPPLHSLPPTYLKTSMFKHNISIDFAHQRRPVESIYTAI